MFLVYRGTCSGFIGFTDGLTFDGVKEVPVENWGGPSSGWRATETGVGWAVEEHMTNGSSANGGGLVRGLRWCDSIDEPFASTTTLVEDCLLQCPGLFGGLDGTCAWEDESRRE